ncbi:putative membrane protein [Leucosporidium creatinivorum]|uniref:Ribosome biogenesis protein NOP53 n=1 Tax=Leucosporidium creatinivorum TaxID=106004 RepID=A0A1Y2G0L0_9BASI|nr:putative membrane protein [Leucosporidium creatinivorum]
MPAAPKQKRSGRANSKKAAPSSSATAIASAADAPLFEIDTVGSSTVRHSLLANAAPANARLRKGTSFNKPLKSDQILAARSSVPALRGKVVPSSDIQARKTKEKLGRVDRATKEKLKRIVGRDGQGEGLWGVKGAAGEGELTEAVKKAGEYDAWEVVVKKSKYDDEAMDEAIIASTGKRVPKAPTSLNTHQLFTTEEGPRSIPLPHPGMSYNPSLPHHQALLANALTHYTAIEDREERGQPIKDAMEEVRRSGAGKELWELYEEEVGSGEDDDELAIIDPEMSELKKKAQKRKTKKQRTAKIMVREEAAALAERRAAKKRVASVLSAPSLNAALEQSTQLSLAEKAAALKIQKARVASQGLTRFRSGPSRVPDAPVTFQLGEELADNLRTLAPEGNLWRDWVGSGMRRGKVPVERANTSKKGGKRGGRGHDKNHKMKEVQKYSYKNFAV